MPNLKTIINQPRRNLRAGMIGPARLESLPNGVS
jgi:hypothetical protein